MLTFMTASAKHMDMNVKESLIKIGLSPREASVYLASVKLGPASAQDIAQQSDEKRGTVYQIIEKLKKQNLMSETQRGKKRLFVAARPSELHSMLRERERVLEEVLPFLKSFAYESLDTPRIKIFNGVGEIRVAYQNTLKSKVSEILTIASADNIMERMGWDWVDTYVNERVRKNIRVRFITTQSDVAKKIISLDAHVLRQTRILKKKSLAVDIEIYGDKVLFLSFKPNPTGFLIESPTIARALALMFNVMWESLE